MGSRRRQPGQPKIRFGFTGPAIRRREDDATVDDILDSMSRRAKLSHQLDHDTLSPLENDLETSDRSFKLPPTIAPIPERNTLGKVAFALILAAGMIVLWLFGALATLLDLSIINKLTQSPTYTSVFTDPVKLGLVALLCFIPVIILRRRHRPETRLLYG
ncbi:MAG TPA: hypothetical protein VI816_04130 [Candidatus Bathyarchaeia archaeon]|nr:hypothetical protein [Candidatus Bathyarchaeia archaeon]